MSVSNISSLPPIVCNKRHSSSMNCSSCVGLKLTKLPSASVIAMRLSMHSYIIVDFNRFSLKSSPMNLMVERSLLFSFDFLSSIIASANALSLADMPSASLSMISSASNRSYGVLCRQQIAYQYSIMLSNCFSDSSTRFSILATFDVDVSSVKNMVTYRAHSGTELFLTYSNKPLSESCAFLRILLYGCKRVKRLRAH